MTPQKAELVTYICKLSQKNGFTFSDLKDIFLAVAKFYFNNATP